MVKLLSCENCGEKLGIGEYTKGECPHCGAKLWKELQTTAHANQPRIAGGETKIECASCNASIAPDHQFCPYCGAEVRQPREPHDQSEAVTADERAEKEEESSNRKWLIAIGLAALFLFLVMRCSGPSNDAPVSTDAKTSQYNKHEVEEMVATVLNLNGHLCARVVSVRPLKMKDIYEVTCIEYRGGRAEVTYILDASKATAFRQ